MKTTHRHSRLGRPGVGMALLLWGSTAGIGLADVQGMIRTTGGKDLVGNIRWQPASKTYSWTDPQSGVSSKLRLDEVAAVKVQQPAQLEPAAKQVYAKQYASAIPVLEKIMQDYAMLQWDVEAARWLADAYTGMNNPAKAVSSVETVLTDNPSAILFAPLARAYWNALLKVGNTATLKKSLTTAAEQGSRELAAAAQIMRGDIEEKEGNTKNALVDGYLRTIVFFQDVKAAQPEALYKAAEAFKKLGQASHADKMRKKLMAEYPRDPYAEKIKAGT